MSQLPSPLTSFVGRASELKRLRELFSSGARLVTLFGAGGIGKTRLALRYAEECGKEVSFCDLADARTLDDVCRALTLALRVTLPTDCCDEDAVRFLADALASGSEQLIVLDNCEQVAPDAARAVAQWCATSTASFVVTSRELLSISGEYAFEVGPLSLPRDDTDTHGEAIELFRDRARHISSSQEWTTREDIATLTAIVRQLEGQPLAIELAAGCLDVWSPRDILGRLPHTLDDLQGPDHSRVSRYPTLRAAIEASWHALKPWQQAALRQCAIFQGGFSMEAAQAVLDLTEWQDAPPVFRVLSTLKAKSLLRVYEVGEVRKTQRFSLYETNRVFLKEQLDASGDVETIRNRHLAWFDLQAARVLESSAGPSAAEEPRVEDLESKLAIDLANMVAARHWALSLEPARVESALRIALSLVPVLELHLDVRQINTLLDINTDAPTGEPTGEVLSLATRALVHRSRMHRRSGRSDLARSCVARALVIANRTVDVAAVMAEQALIDVRSASTATEVASALSHLGSAVDTLAAGSPREFIPSLRGLVYSLAESGRLELARVRALQYCEYTRNMGPGTEGLALMCLGYIMLVEGSLEQAETYCKQAEAMARAANERKAEATACWGLARIAQEAGQFECARERFARAESMIRAKSPGDTMLGFVLGYEATLLHECGDLIAARERYNDALTAMPAATVARAFFSSACGVVHADLGDPQVGRAMIEKAEPFLPEPWNKVALLHKRHVDLAEARAHQARGQVKEAEELRRLAAETLESVDAHFPSEDVRFARRLLARALKDSASAREPEVIPTGVLRIGPGGTWCILPTGERIELGRRYNLQRLLLALAESRRTGDAAVSNDALVQAGWPGETIKTEAGRGRVRTGIYDLRRLGLRDLIVPTESGYMLLPSLNIVMDRSKGEN